MLRRKISGIMLILLLTSMLTLAFKPQQVESESAKEAPVVTSWSAPDGSLPTSFERWKTGYLDATIGKISTGLEGSHKIYVIVDESIYSDLEIYIDRYVSDLINDGFNATVCTFSGGSEIDVKNLLKNAYSNGLAGCLLVGDIPSAWYEINSDWGHEEFPMDLFYMDLDGEWADTDNNGMYDNHTGNRSPEIWVGRIKASGMAESEISLIQNYFDKNHNFRNGILSLPQRALIYIDDDWVSWSNTIDYSVSLAYENRTLVNNKATTEPSDYLSRLSQGWNLVQLLAHGWSGGHQFKINDEWDRHVYSSDIQFNDPNAFFYNLYSCSNARYIETDYIGGWYIFSSTYGVGAISSTKTGGMWYFDDFYQEFKNETLGTSFSKWLTERISDEDANPNVWYDKRWYYGMAILGDPTLSRAPKLSPVVKLIPKVVDLGSGHVVGHNFSVAVVVENVVNLTGLDLKFRWNATYLEYLNHTVTLPNEDYPSPIAPSPYPGILYEPIMVIKDKVDEIAGTYWIACASMAPGPAFNGNGTVFLMAFRVRMQSVVNLEISLHFASTDLANSTSHQIQHTVQTGVVRIPRTPVVVKIIPEVLQPKSGEDFTVQVTVEDVLNLYGLDVQMSWNTHFLAYVNHTVKVPVEVYSDGILHEPEIMVRDEVDTGACTCWIVYASMYPAPPFNGNGIVFEMTFHAKTNGTCVLEIFSTTLVDYSGNPIPHNVANGTIEIIPVPELAVIDISILKNIVGEGYCTRINVTVANQGGFHESSNVTLFGNGTVIDVTSVTILNNSHVTIVFYWNTTSWAKGNYTISSYVAPVPGEINTTDNTLVDGWVFVSIPGDVDGDRDVDIYDVVKITGIYYSKMGDPNYKANSDIDSNGVINIYDVVICTSHYAQSW